MTIQYEQSHVVLSDTMKTKKNISLQHYKNYSLNQGEQEAFHSALMKGNFALTCTVTLLNLLLLMCSICDHTVFAFT